MRSSWLILALGTACTFRVNADGTFTCPDGRCPADLVCAPVTAVCIEEGTAPDADPARPDGAGAPHSPDAAVAPESPAWWDTAWPRRHRIDITPAVGMPAGYAIAVRGAELATLLEAQDGADLRVVRHAAAAGSGAVELDRVIDEGGAGPLWFALVEPLGADTTNQEYYVYAGRPKPPEAPANGQAIFTFFETFDVLPATLQVDGPVSVADGALRLDAGGRVRTTAGFGVGHAVEMRVIQFVPGALASFGFQGDLGGFADDRPRLEWASSLSDPSHVSPTLAFDDGMGDATLMPPVLLDDKARTFGVARPRPDRVVFTAPGSTAGSNQPALLGVGSLQVRAGAVATVLLIPWMRVRPIMEPEPQVSLADGESAP